MHYNSVKPQNKMFYNGKKIQIKESGFIFLKKKANLFNMLFKIVTEIFESFRV